MCVCVCVQCKLISFISFWYHINFTQFILVPRSWVDWTLLQLRRFCIFVFPLFLFLSSASFSSLLSLQLSPHGSLQSLTSEQKKRSNNLHDQRILHFCRVDINLSLSFSFKPSVGQFADLPDPTQFTKGVRLSAVKQLNRLSFPLPLPNPTHTHIHIHIYIHIHTHTLIYDTTQPLTQRNTF